MANETKNRLTHFLLWLRRESFNPSGSSDKELERVAMKYTLLECDFGGNVPSNTSACPSCGGSGGDGSRFPDVPLPCSLCGGSGRTAEAVR